jgi:hypothetical protein
MAIIPLSPFAQCSGPEAGAEALDRKGWRRITKPSQPDLELAGKVGCDQASHPGTALAYGGGAG